MKKVLILAAFLLLFPGGSSAGLPEPAEKVRLLVLPFSGLQDISPEIRPGLAAAEMMEACFSQAEGVALVDRRNLEVILAEQALSLSGLTAEDDVLRVGRLAGAQVMIGGRFHLDGEDLVLNGRAFDVESGVVLAAHSTRNSPESQAELVHELCSALSADLRTGVPQPHGWPVADDPDASLRFMRGLGYYHAARYELAAGEFIAAAEAPSLSVPASLWTARSYIALGEFGNACLELEKIRGVSLPMATVEDIAEARETCRQALDEEEARLIRDLISGD